MFGALGLDIVVALLVFFVQTRLGRVVSLSRWWIRSTPYYMAPSDAEVSSGSLRPLIEYVRPLQDEVILLLHGFAGWDFLCRMTVSFFFVTVFRMLFQCVITTGVWASPLFVGFIVLNCFSISLWPILRILNRYGPKSTEAIGTLLTLLISFFVALYAIPVSKTTMAYDVPEALVVASDSFKAFSASRWGLEIEMGSLRLHVWYCALLAVIAATLFVPSWRLGHHHKQSPKFESSAFRRIISVMSVFVPLLSVYFASQSSLRMMVAPSVLVWAIVRSFSLRLYFRTYLLGGTKKVMDRMMDMLKTSRQGPDEATVSRLMMLKQLQRLVTAFALEQASCFVLPIVQAACMAYLLVASCSTFFCTMSSSNVSVVTEKVVIPIALHTTVWIATWHTALTVGAVYTA